MRKLYLFVNSIPFPEWLSCVSITDDGVFLGSHVCSNMFYMKHDLHDAQHRLDRVKAHFKDEPYEVECVAYEDVLSHPGLTEAFRLNLLQRSEADGEKV